MNITDKLTNAGWTINSFGAAEFPNVWEATKELDNGQVAVVAYTAKDDSYDEAWTVGQTNASTLIDGVWADWFQVQGQVIANTATEALDTALALV